VDPSPPNTRFEVAFLLKETLINFVGVRYWNSTRSKVGLYFFSRDQRIFVPKENGAGDIDLFQE
jgi:hypothetical protein